MANKKGSRGKDEVFTILQKARYEGRLIRKAIFDVMGIDMNKRKGDRIYVDARKIFTLIMMRSFPRLTQEWMVTNFLTCISRCTMVNNIRSGKNLVETDGAFRGLYVDVLKRINFLKRGNSEEYNKENEALLIAEVKVILDMLHRPKVLKSLSIYCKERIHIIAKGN